MAFLLLIVHFLLVPAPPASADDSERTGPVLKSVFSPSSVTIGDRIFYTVTVSYDTGQTVVFSIPDSTQLMPFVLLRKNTRHSGKGLSVFEAELALFDTGVHSLPPVSATVSDSLGDETVLRTSPESRIKVKDLTDSTMTELLPIKPLKLPQRSWIDYLVLLLIVPGVILVIFLLRSIIRRQRGAPMKPVDYRSEVLQKIRELEKSIGDELSPGECYEQLSFLLRTYLEQQYGFSALEAVTGEIRSEIVSRSVPGGDVLIELLDITDLVKFAESMPTTEDCRLSLDQAKHAIMGTSKKCHESR